MAKFRKKVEEFIAHQWLGEGHSVPDIEAVYDKTTDKNTYFVTTSIGDKYNLFPDCWVIYDVNNKPINVLSTQTLERIAEEVQE